MKVDFVLYRILGNDLPPRHSTTQTIVNVRFILDHEPSFEGVEKRWVLNRIADPDVEAALIEMLTSHGQQFLRIRFDADVYSRLHPDYDHFEDENLDELTGGIDDKRYIQLLTHDHSLQHKNRYVMNVNGARNAALREGRALARWIMPWDGNCFLTRSGWMGLRRGIAAAGRAKYIVVPMERILHNEDLLNGKVRRPEALEEPQIVFRADAIEEFDPKLRHGRFSKVEFLRRLGVPGVWDTWNYQPWERKRWLICSDAGRWKRAGWVARLESGHRELDGDASIAGIRERSSARRIAIRTMVHALDAALVHENLRRSPLLFYDESLILQLQFAYHSGQAPLVDDILAEADRALRKRPYHVMQKTVLPASGNRHDYYSPAPFWWPDSDKPDGVPYIRRDGVRIAAAELFSAASLKFDYTRMQQMFSATISLALAARISGRVRYARTAARNVKTWFLDRSTRMRPHLRYAQVRAGHNRGAGAGPGIIEAREICFLIDALRLLDGTEDWSRSDAGRMRQWCSQYLEWLLRSDQGRVEATARNNHGTCYDLQVLALAAYVGDSRTFAEAADRARARLTRQIEPDGAQPQEAARPDALHYCAYNLQSWLCAASVLERAGIDLWSYPSRKRSLLAAALRRFFRDAHDGVLTDAHLEFDIARLYPLAAAGHTKLGVTEPRWIASINEPARAVLHPYAGVPPFWHLVFGNVEFAAESSRPLAAANIR